MSYRLRVIIPNIFYTITFSKQHLTRSDSPWLSKSDCKTCYHVPPILFCLTPWIQYLPSWCWNDPVQNKEFIINITIWKVKTSWWLNVIIIKESLSTIFNTISLFIVLSIQHFLIFSAELPFSIWHNSNTCTDRYYSRDAQHKQWIIIKQNVNNISRRNNHQLIKFKII